MKPARLLTASGLLLLCALQLLALLRTPAAWMPAQVAIALERGDSIVLRRDTLAAPGADERPLRLRRDTSGAWWAASPDGAAPLTVLHGERRHQSGSVRLAAGQRFRLGAAAFTIDALEGHGATLSRAANGKAEHWRYDGALLLRNGQPQAPCPDAHLGARAAAAWNRILPSQLALARPLVFGGNLDCGNRIAIAGLDAPAARIARAQGGEPAGLLLTAFDAPLLFGEGAHASLLAQREENLEAATGLVIGRTRFTLERNGDLLHLIPVSHVALAAEPDRRRLPPGVSRTWTRRPLWHLPEKAPLAFLAAGLPALALAAFLLVRTRRRRRPRDLVHALGAAPLLAAGLALLFLQRQAGSPAGAGIALLAAWAALGFALMAQRRLAPVLGAGLLLLAIGVLAQLELGLGSPESSWLRAFQKSCALLAIAAGMGGLLALVRPARAPAQARVELGLLLLAGLALAGLVLEVVFGDETGVFDLQPVEFAKLALSCLCAHTLALASAGQGGSGGRVRRWMRLGAPVLLFLVLLAVALVQVDDYSPLILLALWGGALALGYALATRQRLVAAGLLGLALLAALGVAGLRSMGAGEIARWNFYPDRFLVWLDPGTHPHTGQQLLLGARAIAAGGWRGADGWFGLLSLGQDAGPALRVPAVQDDFAAAFFLERHGLAAALLLWGLQGLFLTLLLRAALSCWLSGRAARDFRLAWLARFRCFLLLGCGAFAFGHFLLSWGTNLAIFPVMGQPMSFLSAGGSHLLFFICPLLGLAAASSQSLEENESCRSTSNMKP